MAELSIATTDATARKFDTDDVANFQTTSQILLANTERIVQSTAAGWQWGLAPNTPGCLRDKLLAAISQYKFQRVSKHEVDRINLQTNETFRFKTGTATNVNGKLEQMDVDLFFRRRAKHEKHNLFATQGDFSDAYYYGGRLDASEATVASIWPDIEAALTGALLNDNKKTQYRASHFRKYLVLTSYELTMQQITELLSPVAVYNEITGEPMAIHQRLFAGLVEATGLPSAAIRDRYAAPDYRDFDKFVVDEITERKRVLLAMKYQLLIDELTNDPAAIGYKTGANWKPDNEIAALLNAKGRSYQAPISNASLVKWAAAGSRWANIEDAASPSNTNKQVRSIAKAALRMLEANSGPLDVTDQDVAGMVAALESANVITTDDKTALLALSNVTNKPRWEELGISEVDILPNQVEHAISMIS